MRGPKVSMTTLMPCGASWIFMEEPAIVQSRRVQLDRSGVIWFNGRLVPWDEARVHVLSHALHYASSVFEGIRAYKTPRGIAIMCLAEHVERLLRSCKLAELPLAHSRETITAAILA